MEPGATVYSPANMPRVVMVVEGTLEYLAREGLYVIDASPCLLSFDPSAYARARCVRSADPDQPHTIELSLRGRGWPW